MYASAMSRSVPHIALAQSLGRWLSNASRMLVDRDLHFEAGSAREISEKFQSLAENNGSLEDFVGIWNDLEDWGESAVTNASGAERQLCETPMLPDALSC
jgi:hypothetical protein